MTLVWNAQAPRRDMDVAGLYVEARAAGLVVSHYASLDCVTFDASPRPAGALGVFRTIGALKFDKDDRTWEVRARSDANAVELATLIAFGLEIVAKHGRSPGHWTRQRMFHHFATDSGKRIAWARVAYRLSADDLLNATSEAVSVEEFVARVLEESQS